MAVDKHSWCVFDLASTAVTIDDRVVSINRNINVTEFDLAGQHVSIGVETTPLVSESGAGTAMGISKSDNPNVFCVVDNSCLPVCWVKSDVWAPRVRLHSNT